MANSREIKNTPGSNKKDLSESKHFSEEQKNLRNILTEIDSLPNFDWVSFKSISFDKMPSFKKLYNENDEVQMFLAAYDNSPITKSNLYDAVITHWFSKSKDERMLNGTLPSDGSNCIDTYFEFAGELAKEMSKADAHVIDKKNESIWNMFFANDSNEELVYARKACPLVRVGDSYEFIHPILENYFIARSVAQIRYSDKFDSNFTRRTL